MIILLPMPDMDAAALPEWAQWVLLVGYGLIIAAALALIVMTTLTRK